MRQQSVKAGIEISLPLSLNVQLATHSRLFTHLILILVSKAQYMPWQWQFVQS